MTTVKCGATGIAFRPINEGTEECLVVLDCLASACGLKLEKEALKSVIPELER